MNWYPNKGQKGYDWQRTIKPYIPYLNNETNSTYKDLAKNWRNSSLFWYSANPTSNTPQNEQRDVASSVAQNQEQTQQGLSGIQKEMNARGLGNSSANQYAQSGFGTSQANQLAGSVTGIQDKYERGKYMDWLKWQATAAERKNQQDKIRMIQDQMQAQATALSKKEQEANDQRVKQERMQWLSMI